MNLIKTALITLMTIIMLIFVTFFLKDQTNEEKHADGLIVSLNVNYYFLLSAEH